MQNEDPNFERGVSEEFWNDWNRRWRPRDKLDDFMRRQLDIATSVARSLPVTQPAILGVGCGTGWMENGLLGYGYGRVWGTDLSPEAILEGKKQYSGVNLLCGDFMTAELPGPFDLIVSADSLVPMPDHAAAIERCAKLLNPGGTFLLMTQNPFVWSRRSRFERVNVNIPHADPSAWPTRKKLLALLDRHFVVERVSTFDPGGDTGIIWWVEYLPLIRLMSRLVGYHRWKALLERMGLGRELVFIARRRQS